MDNHTDTDFLALKAENSQAHARLEGMAKENARRQEKLDAILAEVVQFNKSIATKLFGNGSVGCMETQRAHDAFLKSLKRILWMMGTPIVLGSVAMLIAVAKHLLSQ